MSHIVLQRKVVCFIHLSIFFRRTDICDVARNRYIASGQGGENADVIVWDFEEKRLLYRMQSHDSGIAAIAFSHDDKLLLSVGVASDNRCDYRGHTTISFVPLFFCLRCIGCLLRRGRLGKICDPTLAGSSCGTCPPAS